MIILVRIVGSRHTFDTFCFVQTGLMFLALGAVFQSHSVASLLTADEKSLYFGLEEGKYSPYIHSGSISVITFCQDL